MEPRELFVAFMTIVTREIRRFMRIWVQTLIPPAITMALYFVMMSLFKSVKHAGTKRSDMLY